MEIYLCSYRGGKVSEAIKSSKETRKPIICPDLKRVEEIIEQAKKLKIDIPKPKTMKEYLKEQKEKNDTIT